MIWRTSSPGSVRRSSFIDCVAAVGMVLPRRATAPGRGVLDPATYQGRRRSVELGHHRRVIARPIVREHRAAADASGEVRSGEDVVDPPPDVPLAQVPPRRPVREEAVVRRIHRPPDVHEAVADEALEERALVRALADRALLPFLRVHVQVGPRDVEVARDDEGPARRARLAREGGERLEEPQLRRIVLPAVRDVDRRDRRAARLDGDDARLHVEGRVHVRGRLRRDVAPDEEGDAGVGGLAVPEAPVAVEVAERGGDARGRRLDLLEADDPRPLARHELEHLRLARPDAVHVPGDELHHDRVILARRGAAPHGERSPGRRRARDAPKRPRRVRISPGPVRLARSGGRTHADARPHRPHPRAPRRRARGGRRPAREAGRAGEAARGQGREAEGEGRVRVEGRREDRRSEGRGQARGEAGRKGGIEARQDRREALRAREALPDRVMSRRAALLSAAVLAAAGLALALVLVFEHASAHAGGASFCAISEYVNCDRVATSPFSVVLGLPVAAWGALGYGLALVLALAGLAPGRRREGWPAGLLALLAAAVRAVRPEGVRVAVQRDLALVRERKGTAAALAVAALALVLGIAAAYPRYWSRAASRGAGVPVAGGEAMSQGPLTVVEYSDYACPACARAHAETKALLAGRPGIRLVRRHFPLDSVCNPVLKRRMHPGACDLARVGICAEGQGKLEPTEDALFANQLANRPVEEVVRAVGLDVEKLRACLVAPETEARLRSDVEAGIRAGLKATPTFVVGGRLYSGELPPEALPPRTAAVRP